MHRQGRGGWHLLDGGQDHSPTKADLVIRGVRIFTVLVRRFVLWGWLRGRGKAPAVGEWLATTVSQLGPACIKAAQLLSTRVDVLPPRICQGLARLHDDVAAPPAVDLSPVLEQHLGPLGRTITAQNLPPAASGSIACVYRVTSPDGRVFAVKVRRPGIERLLAVDLALLRGLARMLAWTPPLRGVPVLPIVDQLASCIREQADFVHERDRLRTLHDNLDGKDRMRVPRPVPELCTSEVLVMEYLEGLGRDTARRLSTEGRHDAVVSALRAVYRMLFRHGLVHCDLHPGNLYFRADGTVALVDAGFTVQLTPYAQTKFTAFFYCMSLGDGPASADVVLSTATPGPRTDEVGFRRELARLVEAHSGARAADFDLVSFASRLFDLQRRYGLYADPQFVFPILSLLVLEGSVRDLHPDVDFQREAKPFLTAAVLERAVLAARE